MKQLNYNHFKIVISFLLIVLIGCSNNQEISQKAKTSLKGAWTIDKTTWISKDTSVTLIPKNKGYLLITNGNYSIAWSSVERRIPFKSLSNPTQEETITGFQSIVFNSGYYNITDSTFTTTAKLAKVPGFEGGKQFYNYIFQNDSIVRLTLFDEMYPDNSKPNWSGKWKTEFVLKRLKSN